jgi:hypothetical protein
MTTDRFKDGVQWWMDTTRPMSEALFPNPPQWHIDTGNLVRLVPQREWVELTDDEVMEMMGYDKQYGHIPQYARNFVEAISAKLKEKNT